MTTKHIALAAAAAAALSCVSANAQPVIGWDPPSEGTPPYRYRIHGIRGGTHELLGETQNLEWKVELPLNEPVRIYVTAVDPLGRESPPSEVIAIRMISAVAVGLSSNSVQRGQFWIVAPDGTLLGVPSLGNATYITENGSTRAVAYCDFDGDKDLDAAILFMGYSSQAGNARVEIQINNGGVLSAAREVSLARPEFPSYVQYSGLGSITCGDDDADLKAEIMVGFGLYSHGNMMRIEDASENYEATVFPVGIAWRYYDVNGATFPEYCEIDGDGVDELVIGMGGFPGDGGWAIVLDDVGRDPKHVKTIRFSNAEYDSAWGAVTPICGNFDGDAREEVMLVTEPWNRVVNGQAQREAGLVEVFDDWKGGMKPIGSVDIIQVAMGAEFGPVEANRGKIFCAALDWDVDGFFEPVCGMEDYPGSVTAGSILFYDDMRTNFAYRGRTRSPNSAYSSQAGGTYPAKIR